MASLLLEATLSRGRLAGPLQVTKLDISSQVVSLPLLFWLIVLVLFWLFSDPMDAVCYMQLAVLCSLLAWAPPAWHTNSSRSESKANACCMILYHSVTDVITCYGQLFNDLMVHC